MEEIAVAFTSLHNVMVGSFDAQYDELGVRVVRVDSQFSVFVALPVTLRGGLYVKVRGPTERFRAGLGAEYTHTGDVDFDRVFHIEAADTLSALLELSVAVRASLLELATHTGDITVVQAHVRGLFESPGAVIEALPTLATVARALRNAPRPGNSSFTS